MTLAEATREAVAVHGAPDVVLVSGMVDLAGWLGLTRRFLGDPPVVLYLHENQLLHPLSPNQRADDEFPLVNWRGMAAADQVWSTPPSSETACWQPSRLCWTGHLT